MFRESLFVCDRFHYTGHKCSAFFDPDVHRSCENVSTTGAEAINKQWRTLRKHIRFLSAENIVPFPYVRMLYINIRAHLPDQMGASDVGNERIVSFANRFEPCQCERCTRNSS